MLAIVPPRPFLPASAVVFALVACGGGDGDSPATPDERTVAEVAVAPPAVTIPVGESTRLEATVRDSSGQLIEDLAVRWTSSDAAVATVDGGLVEAVSVGTATVSATVEGVTGESTVTVTATSTEPSTITLDAGTVYQTIIGWEATAEVGQSDFPQEFHAWREEVVDRAANELGLNRIRLEIRSGAEHSEDFFTPYVNGTGPRSAWVDNWYRPENDNGDPFTVNAAGFQFAELDHTIDYIVNPLREKVAANGEELYVNLNFVDFSPEASFEHRDSPDEYAELILATFDHIQQKYGWTPDAVEVLLEPDNSTGWTTNELGRALAAAGQRLEANGYAPDVVAPSTTAMSSTVPWFDDVIQVSGVSTYLTDLSYHRYGGVSEANLREIADRARQHGLRTAMLEHIGSGHQDLHQDLTIGLNSSWQQFALAFPTRDNGAQYYLVDRSTAAVSMGSRTKFLRQYFRFVRSGARRVKASSQDPALDPLGFINEDGTYVVVVNAEAGAEFSVGGIPPGTYGISYTTETESDVEPGNLTIGAGEALHVAIPAAGVLTIHGMN